MTEEVTSSIVLQTHTPPSPELVADGSMLAILVLVGILFASGPLIIAMLVSPRATGRRTGEIYECGMPSFGKATAARFGVFYYLYALIFIVFEVDVLYLFPIAKIYRQGVGLVGFVEILFFVIVLFLAIIYAWKKGVMKWEREALSLR